MSAPTPFALTLQALAQDAPDAPAVSDESGTISRSELNRQSNRWARAMSLRGVRPGDIVSICLPSDRSFVVAAWAVWKLGATPQPLSPRIAPHELQAILDLTRPTLLIGRAVISDTVATWDTTGADDLSADPLEPLVAPSWKAPTSGGSTGRPKVILSTSPAVTEPLLQLAQAVRIRPQEVLLAPAPLHHNGPFLTSTMALLSGGHVVLMQRFDPETALELIAQHRVGWVYAVPTIMSRIAKLDPQITATADLSSVHTLFHMAAPCAPWLKHWWIGRLGADAVWELYAGTEAQAITTIGGQEWLRKPGSVGRPLVGEVTVLDEQGAPVPAGVVGEVFLRAAAGATTYRYLGAEPRRVDDWESLGDMGYLDADGYLYLCDRSTDMVLVGGVNVYPAEVEAALESHPAVESSCVIGLPDDDLGNQLRAVVHLTEDVDDDSLHAFLAERLAPYKRPRAFARTDHSLRDEAGKIRRSAVRAAMLERLPA